MEAEQAARRELSEAEQKLADADELKLPALWNATHKRLDYYHEIATGQARQSFRNAQIAMATGFILLVGFAVLAFFAQTTAAAVVTGALGAVATAFPAYIGRTFVRSQETAATHLRSYFDQPLEFSRYLAAERLLNGVERLDASQRATIIADVLLGIPLTPKADDSEKPEANTSADK
ncbi:TRADD-N-associated membrane domain-containing protein [Nonomuraea bangladeshensis]|uniref:TRADD-N-associated membrane domain-containing protein n=1 Tax=Nonomuraea bangladeshensis TaxID=404385 RepID=UPI003C2E6791